MPDARFHPGELAVQARAGLAADAQRVGRSIGATLDARAAEFLAAQRLAVLAGADEAGALWASPLIGEPGFARVPREDVLELAAALASDDPLAGALRPEAPVGALAIDLENRRRIRVNGVIASRTSERLQIQLREAFWNCPKYIQRRVLENPAAASSTATRSVRDWVASADTFFVASAHAQRGLDASHRGGASGFVRVLGDDALAFPDYAGNAMFQTLGNLELDSRVGLAFPDFARGRCLQLSGTARIDWSPERAASFRGAERVIDVRIQRVVERALPGAERWRLVEPSPHNP